MHSLGGFTSHSLGTALLSVGVLLAVGIVTEGYAQVGPSLQSTERPVRVSLDPTYQYYDTENGSTLTQLSTQVMASVPVGRRFTIQARAGYARSGGGQLAQVQGLTDATGRVSYAQPVGEGSVVFAATVNAPVGKQELDPAALATARQIGRNYYDFRVSSFSRGFSVAPRVTWAVPVTDQLAVGIGAGYQHQRGFRPRADVSDSYVPGDEVGVNGGFDYQFTETSALGVDVAFKRYAPDRLGGTRRFDAGSRISGTVRYLVRSGFTTIRAVAQYANWEESEFGYRFGGADRGQVIPSHAMVLGSYQTRLSDQIDLRVRASGHQYAETIQADQKLFGRIFLSPSFELGEAIVLAPHGTATYGSYLGLGGGLRVEGEF